MNKCSPSIAADAVEGSLLHLITLDPAPRGMKLSTGKWNSLWANLQLMGSQADFDEVIQIELRLRLDSD